MAPKEDGINDFENAIGMSSYELSLSKNSGDATESSPSSSPSGTTHRETPPSSPEPISDEVPVGEVAAAAWREDSIFSVRNAALASSYAGLMRPEDRGDVHPVDRLEALSEIPEEDHEHYNWCRTNLDFGLQTASLRQIRQDRELLSRYPKSAFIAGMAVNIMDMAPLIPTFVRMAAAAAKPVATAAARSGGTMLARAGKAAYTGAKEGAKFGAIYSGVKLRTRDMYDLEDAALETAATSLTGGLLGVGVLGISAAVRSKYVKALKDKLSSGFAESRFGFAKPGDPKSVYEVTISSTGTKSMFTYANMPPRVQQIISYNPITQGLGSDSQVLQRYTDSMYRHGFMLKMHEEGITSVFPSEVGKEMHNALFCDMGERFLSQSGEWVKNFPQYSDRDFGLAVVRNIKFGENSQDPLVAEGTRIYREHVKRDIDDAVRFKLFEDPRLHANDDTYFTTVYKRDFIAKNETEFMENATAKFLRENPALSEDEARKAAYSVFDNIMGDNLEKYGILWLERNGKISITKARKFLKTKEDFEIFEKYLVNDPLEVADILRKTLRPRIEAARVAEEAFANSPLHSLPGFSEKPAVEKWLFALEDERDNLLRNTASNEEKELIRQKYNKYAQLIADGAKLLSGTYGAPTCSLDLALAQKARALKAYNYMRLLGSVGFSALVDQGNVVHRFGIVRTLKGALHGFFKDSAFQLNKADLVKWGAASERAMTGEVHRYLTDTDMSLYRNGRLMTSLDKLSNTFSKFTFLERMNDYNKVTVATLHGTDVIEACMKDKLTLKDSKFLAMARIPLKMRGKINEYFHKYGGGFDKDGLAVFDMGKWPDDDVTRTFAASLTTAANQTIIIPSAGDTPRVFKSTIGRLLTQFKSYQFAVWNNVILPWFNGQNEHVAASIATRLAIATTIVYCRAQLSGNPFNHLDDKHFIMEVVDKADLLGPLTDVVSMISRVSDTNRSLGQTVERAFPTAGTLTDLWYLKNEALKYREDPRNYNMSERTARTIKGLVPFNNIFLWDGIVNRMIRHHVFNKRGKLMKTREQRYREGKRK